MFFLLPFIIKKKKPVVPLNGLLFLFVLFTPRPPSSAPPRPLQTPKIMITTRPRPSGNLFHFVQDLLRMIPNAFFYPRSESLSLSSIFFCRFFKKISCAFFFESLQLDACAHDLSVTYGVIAAVFPTATYYCYTHILRALELRLPSYYASGGRGGSKHFLHADFSFELLSLQLGWFALSLVCWLFTAP